MRSVGSFSPVCCMTQTMQAPLSTYLPIVPRIVIFTVVICKSQHSAGGICITLWAGASPEISPSGCLPTRIPMQIPPAECWDFTALTVVVGFAPYRFAAPFALSLLRTGRAPRGQPAAFTRYARVRWRECTPRVPSCLSLFS